MSDFRGRGGRVMRGRGGPPRGGPRGGGRGSYSGDREGSRGGFSRGRGDGFSRARGDGFSRGRGGPPSRHMSRDDSPPRKVPMMSRGYDSDRGRGPPVGRHSDRYEDSYDRRPPPRGRDSYPSPSRDTGRLLDRLSPPRSSLRDRDYGVSSRGNADYPSSRGDYLPQRSYSPPRETGSYRDSYGSSLRELREDRRETFSRQPARDYPQARSSDYGAERSRDFRDSPRDYGSSRDYPSHRGSDFRESLGGRGEFRDVPPRERLPPRDFEDDHDLPPRGGGHQVNTGRHEQGRGHLDHRSRGQFEHRDDTLGHGGDREYSSSRFSSRLDDRVSSRGPPARDYPPSREYGGRGGGPRGSMRGGRDDRGGGRGGFMNGSRGRGGPPRGRARPEFSGGRGGRRSPPPSRDGPLGKRPRMDSGDGYSSRR